MAVRLAVRLPRLVVLGAVLLFASATLTWGAAKRLTAVPPAHRPPVSKPTVLVPDVAGQAFVFAKGTLEDAGFAWQVTGKVRGFSVNTVASQSPAAGVKLVDTGAPVVTVTLSRGRYAEAGEPEDVSPYIGTPVVLAGRLPVAKPVVPAASTGNQQKPTSSKPAPSKNSPSPKTADVKRTPAFVVAGAPSEPRDEITLTVRARRLDAWLERHQQPTTANVNHFLYQHSWIVTGAGFGWSHGAEALRILIDVDRHARAAWGVGSKSELVARRALAEVEAKTR